MPDSDVQRLLDRFDQLGLEPATATRGWNHMGAVLADAALQPRTNYASVVAPRVREFVRNWPEAATTSGLLRVLRHHEAGSLLRWAGGRKLLTFHGLVDLVAESGAETVGELRMLLTDDALKSALRRVRGVGPKTASYLPILCGAQDEVAVDTHVRQFVKDAGVNASDVHCRELLREAALSRGLHAGALDGPIWEYQSTNARRH